MESNAKKRILLITAGFPCGESEQSFLRTEFLQLCRLFDVTVLAMNTREPVIHEIPEPVTVERYALPPLRRGKTLLRLPRLLCRDVLQELTEARRGCGMKQFAKRAAAVAAAQLNALAAADDLARIVQRDGIHLIYSYWCTPMTLAALQLKKKFPHLKVITRFHGIDLYDARTECNWQPLRNVIAEKCDRLVFACKSARDYFLNRWGSQYQEKSVVSYLGCPPKEPLLPTFSKPLQLVSCSNLIPLKRVELIIDALSLLPEAVAVHWRHIGDGPERSRLIARAKEKLHENVRWEFCGALANEEVFAYYRRIGTQLFLTASSTEGGVPVSLQECAAMGIAGIGTAVGGIPEIIADGKTGYLLPADATAAQIRDAIVAFCNLTDAQRSQMHMQVLALWQDRFNARTNAYEFIQMVQGLFAP